MNKKQKQVRAVLLVAALALIGIFLWKVSFSPTKVAFLNYQVIELGQIAKANESSSVKIKEIDPEHLEELKHCDMLFINGMGLHITEEQRAQIEKAAQKGLPVITTNVTNPANNIISVDEEHEAALKAYVMGAGRRNYRNMLYYVRREIDRKTSGTDPYEPAVPRANEPFYHSNIEQPEEEDLGFYSVAQYDAYLQKHGLLKQGADRIVVTGQMGDPTDLVKELERTGNVVYCVRNFDAFLHNGQADSVQASAVINMAHGRMGDEVVSYLTQRNIPLFCPVNVNRLVDDWENDKMGMNGGFMSQSIVTPEIDGAIRPFALFGHYTDENGLQQLRVIPDRCREFVENINRQLALKKMPNSEKKVAIYYYKGPGQSALTAAGMEVIGSLYNMLVRMKAEGYRIEHLPASPEALAERIQQQGAIFGTYAEGAVDNFIRNGNPELIDETQYNEWCQQGLRPESIAELERVNGAFPGAYMATSEGKLALARIDLGNVVLLPQLPAGGGKDTFKMVHGTESAPPHAYVASYLWSRYAFGADVLMHFGTHGSLEFTPRKQVALSSSDWPDRLVGTTPHIYIYTIADVGEGVIAKRRSYATLMSHLTPPFMESNLRGVYRELNEAFKKYNNSVADEALEAQKKAALEIKRLTVKMGIHRELRLDSVLTTPYSDEEITRIENFADELASEKITGAFYTLGEAYQPERIRSTVFAMATEPIAYSMLALDKLKGRADANLERKKAVFTRRYVEPARILVGQLLQHPEQATDDLICRVSHISAQELAHARKVYEAVNAPSDMMSMMRKMAQMKTAAQDTTASQASADKPKMPAGHPKMPKAIMEKMKKMGVKNMDDVRAMMGGKVPAAMKGEKGEKGEKSQKAAKANPMEMMMKMMKQASYSKEEVELARTILEIERTILNVGNYSEALRKSPELEFQALLNALNGGYTVPSPGGDPIANPNTIPTGKNLFGINAEATPSEAAWERGIRLAQSTIDMYRSRHNDSIPRKVSYTLWSGEFIESEGATIAQVLYMLGVEPIRDMFGRVNDLRLIPSAELGRPRIDVVVQTSGQLRDIAASRLFLISRAVEMAAASTDDKFDNFVSKGVVDAEKALIEKGLSPKEAREISTYRVFGGVNGNYGTGITGMVQSGDRWEDASEIAAVYLNNMGAFYGSEKNWEQVKQYAFEAALTNTDAVIQPRQSNTWGAMSLDHVYEFMGGMNLAVKTVTGKEPDAYLSDYRNRNHVRMQELKEAIGVESRSTIFNPTYIKEKMKGEASDAANFAEILQNTYGWNVMKPEVIDDELWDEVYEVYVKDKYNLGVQHFFEEKSPAALQEMTAVMMETARKGMWQASQQQLADIAKLHTDLIERYKPACSGHVCDNAKLRSFIASNTDAATAKSYQKSVQEVRQSAAANDKGVVMKKEELQQAADRQTTFVNNMVVILLVAAALAVFVFIVRKRRKSNQE